MAIKIYKEKMEYLNKPLDELAAKVGSERLSLNAECDNYLRRELLGKNQDQRSGTDFR